MQTSSLNTKKDFSPVTACEALMMKADEVEGLPRVVIVGAGFGGLAAAKALAKAPVNVTVIDRHNYHLFQPLLYQVATAALSPADIAWPIRSILKGQKNTRVILDKVTGVNAKENAVMLENGGAMRYDYLILATGARHSYFGKDEWEKTAPGIKTIADATTLRQKILLAFERAEVEKDPEERARLLTFVIIGGGPTGVEMAGAIAELARHSIADDFAHISPGCTRIVLVEAGPRVLAQFPENLSERAKETLERVGVEIMTNVRVENVDALGITAADLKIGSRNVIWAAGVKSSPAGEWLGAVTDRSGRVIVNARLNPEGHSNVFVIGDTAAYTPEGKDRPLPGVAPVAKQMGSFVAKTIQSQLSGTGKPKEKTASEDVFEYKDFGAMATIGRNSAVADIGGFHLCGFIGWWLWGFAHVYFLIGLKNRISVAMNWFWQYITWQRGVRLITSDPKSIM